MASTAEEEVEYESDPEEAKRSLTMRRREASDDEEEEEGDGDERKRPVRRIDPRDEIGSDGELDGQGAPEEYYDEESEIEEEELLEEEEEEEVLEEEEYGVRGGKEVEGGDEVEDVAVEAMEASGVVRKKLDEERERDLEESTELQGVDQVEEEEKKENEPFAVPTAGAFYMHDDRFRDNAGGRNRRTLGGRKLWESKDNKKWGHDKFEEMTLQDRHYEEGTRNSRGYRGRGKNRGADRGNPRGNKPKAYNNNNQNQGPKGVRGRGPRRYEPSWKNNNVEAPPTQQRHGSGKSSEKNSHTTSGRAPTATGSSNVESDIGPARKQMFGSSLSSASPPFYPSGSSNKEITLTQKRDVQAGTINRNLRSPVVDDNFSMPESSTMMRGKNVAGSSSMEKLYINDSISPIVGKSSSVLQLPPSGSSLVNTTQPLQPRAHGRGLASSGQMTFQPGAPHNQVSRASPPPQLHAAQRSHAQSRVQPSLQASVQQLGQRPGSGSQTSSPPKAALSIKSFESGELESPPESSKLKTALVEKGKGGVQVSARSSFMYGGAQIMGASGNMGSGHGDQNFAASPAFLPVMPFGGQHPGGIGVPAVAMAFPGYVAQPQLGLGNSEMTWLPVLAGAAGALGATYCSPYISVDGAYHSRPSGQTSSTGASSKESNTNKHNEWKPSQRPEVASDEFGQRQKNTRRYTEMNFGQ
ncbi:protein MLN51 homolog [Actinidia eriantha]|uniref:protein MLN51 homolog n=1 Tax=Actinidia eriantha TaxID=165200 RepID=UPI00258B3A64|nr:protein MLN51 homolog [Actinidia eriantha]XP_057514815.1 protein MLN51 homolog [Actinidia eriantha]XP_057514816.1 protein MLN51 homolog [Actinidia eriantha]